MICKNCGHECYEGKFCSECGAPLDEVKTFEDAIVPDEEKKAELPSLDELKEIAKNAEAEREKTAPDDGIYRIDKAEYDKAVEMMGVYKAKSSLPFYLVCASVFISCLSILSLIYFFGSTGSLFETILGYTAYLNIPALCLALCAFSISSHWFLAAKEYKFLKNPAFVTTTFVFSVLAVVFAFTCFCAFTIPIIFFPF